DPTGKGQTRWTMRWKTALNAFAITFNGRLSTARQQTQPPQSHRSFDRPYRDNHRSSAPTTTRLQGQ
ncbi:hypothetical protein AB0L67_42275, partial [Streptomyces flaveolus]|uniref:hypothetical protein n=1 Tax=Streptomyces flaveolus TaxID=67297 RepID=UPI00341B07A2